MSNQQLAADAIRFLAADAVELAQSGHPGMPMGMADIAEVLWNQFLKHNPCNPAWPNRDRFVVSNGHGSMLLYAILHLSGYDLPLEELKKFRQLGSKTPGHPEFGLTPGVETTTGPLGQGIANAVGMAAAEKHLAAKFNTNEHNIIDYNTYCFLGDGCLMEGISHEACSLAGTWGLGKLIVFWDDNGISIDGEVTNWFSDNTTERFKSYNWQVLSVDGHDPEEIAQAIKSAQANTTQPTIIACKTKIGHGAPNLTGTAKIHGNPLGEQELEQLRLNLDWPHMSMHVPEEIYELWNAHDKGASLQTNWDDKFANYADQNPELAAKLLRLVNHELPANYQAVADDLLHKSLTASAQATRKASKNCITAFSECMPELIGGSADVSDSVNTLTANATAFGAQNPSGNYIHFGVREFAMAAIANGLALSNLRPFIGTYLVFSDYARSAIRMSALMQQPIIYILSHDSIALGQDGPTHQPIEHIASLRLIPGLNVWRPADNFETAIAWTESISNTKQPSVLALTRQTVPELNHTIEQANNIKKGGYCISDCSEPCATIIATGSEVELALEVAKTSNFKLRVVSMPCLEIFLAQDKKYQTQLLPDSIPVFTIEAGAPDNWYRFTRSPNDVFAISEFGESAPGPIAYKHFGFDSEKIRSSIEERIAIYRQQHSTEGE